MRNHGWLMMIFKCERIFAQAFVHLISVARALRRVMSINVVLVPSEAVLCGSHDRMLRLVQEGRVECPT